ncbi:cap-specific mRNA (nucleoside-2'-O-)-methyltransferase 2 [Anopheles ziemanni]|uniref:cap-specific mRNA (nucleoside-2'-O-)-methyltransferase 2 n=1 Tax=Anopheles coustani TaxID=139045 RepID=UPI002657EB67|nr:cap-specific mRNA (nucleoside-2'-O-)-methyltransferase 2 [Anopheles coustani]XP_058168628.1 cap-specific mRNA (nucleoside-2'-O-)-methyltransferase 2 [Anopheles ziemanni]
MKSHSHHNCSDDDSDILRREKIIHDVRVQFAKKFQFPSTPSSTLLPRVDTLYRCPPYLVPRLQEQKRKLNAVKSRLNDFEIGEWHQHSRKRSSLLPILNELRYRIRAEFVTQAFAKLYECVSAYELVDVALDQLYSVHLCEAPGAFVTGLNHYIRLNCHPKIRWHWFACTLNPYHEGNCHGSMIPDDRFIRHTLDSWCFGVDGTGDIMVRENRDDIIARSKQWPEVNLVTADGSIDCLNFPEEQEERVSKLHFAEATLALSILAPGGHFILKMFTLFEHSSVNMLFLLNMCFDELHVFKPCTSKPGNSEVYLIAKHYRKPAGIEQYLDVIYSNIQNSSYTLFDPTTIPEAFLEQMHVCASQFVRWQTEVIESNIRFYDANDPCEDERLIIFKETIIDMFFTHYRITPIRATERIVRGKNVTGGTNIYHKESHGTYNERVQSSLTESRSIEQHQYLRDRLDHVTLTHKELHPRALLDDAPYGFGTQYTLQKELSFAVGKAVERVKNSYYALITHLRLLNDIVDLYRSIAINPDPLPKDKLVPMVQNNVISIDIRLYPSIMNADWHEKQLYHTIVRTILQLAQQAGETPVTGVIDPRRSVELIVENWLMLTRFSVGLFYLLKMYVFEANELLSSTRIAFRHLRSDGITNLLAINDAYGSACCSTSALPGTSKSILTLVSPASPLNGDYKYGIINYNNALCLIYCARLLDEMEQHLGADK